MTVAHMAGIGASLAGLVALAKIGTMDVRESFLRTGNFTEASMMRTTKGFGGKGQPKHTQNKKRNSNS